MLSNHELAKRYKDKAKLLGEDKLVLMLLEDDCVKLVDVKDKNDSGKLVIPSFITDFDVRIEDGIVVQSPLIGCSYEEIHIDNKRDISLKGLCSGMDSIKIKLSVRDPKKVTDVSYLFEDSLKVKSIDISGLFRGNKVKDMGNMFSSCMLLKEINFSGIDTSGVEDMSYMYNGCVSISNVDMSMFNTKNVRSMRGMFNGVGSIESIDISNFNTNNVVDMTNMFRGCYSLSDIDVNKISMINVKEAKSMFSECINLKHMDMSSVNGMMIESIDNMFIGCSGLEVLDISGLIGSIDINKSGVNSAILGCKRLKKLVINKMYEGKISKKKVGIITGCDSKQLIIDYK